MNDYPESTLVNLSIQKLSEEYGYPSKQIKREVLVSKDLRTMADIVVYDLDNKPKIIVEVKAYSELLPLHKIQLKSLMRSLNVKYGMYYNGFEQFCFELVGDNLYELDDIPTNVGFDKKIIKKDLELSKTSIWKILEESQKYLHREFVIESLLQILVCKLIDEQDPSLSLFQSMDNDHKENYLRFQDLWNNVKYVYPSLIGEELRIEPEFATLVGNTIKKNSISKTDMLNIVSEIFNFYKPRNFEPIELPDEIVQMMIKLFPFKINHKTFYPSTGMGRGLLSLFNYVNYEYGENSLKHFSENLVCTELNKKSANILNLIFILIIGKTNVHNFEEVEIEKIHNYNQILITRPIFANKSEYEKINIESYLPMIINQLDSKGRIIAVVPRGFLFNENRRYQRARFLISDLCHIKGIIKLPKGVLLPQTAVSCAILILDKKYEKNSIRHNVFVADLDLKQTSDKVFDSQLFDLVSKKFHEFDTTLQLETQDNTFFICRSLELEERGNWDLKTQSPLTLKLSEILNAIKLHEVAEVYTGKPLLSKNLDEGIQIPYLRISDLEDGIIKEPIGKSIFISKSKLNKISPMYRVNPFDILISVQGTIGKVAMATEKDIGAYLSPQLAVIRVRSSKIIPEYLLYILSSELIQEQLGRLAQGSVIKRISVYLLRELIIPLPPIKEQEKLIAKFKNQLSKVENLQMELKEAKEKLRNFRFD